MFYGHGADGTHFYCLSSQDRSLVNTFSVVLFLPRKCIRRSQKGRALATTLTDSGITNRRQVRPDRALRHCLSDRAFLIGHSVSARYC
jgi:hypothetical protein